MAQKETVNRLDMSSSFTEEEMAKWPVIVIPGSGGKDDIHPFQGSINGLWCVIPKNTPTRVHPSVPAYLDTLIETRPFNTVDPKNPNVTRVEFRDVKRFHYQLLPPGSPVEAAAEA